MSSYLTKERRRTRDLVGLLTFVAICLGVSAIGGAVTATSVGSWYQGLHKPSFNPPDWIFAPVWTALYILIAFAGWRVWRAAGLRAARAAFVLYALQLALNLAWSILFFGFRLIGLALIEIVILFVAILATMVALWQRDRLAGMLLVPYGTWVLFAAALNAALWRLN
jgi:benzodiazapine receptor